MKNKCLAKIQQICVRNVKSVHFPEDFVYFRGAEGKVREAYMLFFNSGSLHSFPVHIYE